MPLRVQPRASRDEITGWRQQVLAVRVTAPPVEGEANRAVVALVAKALGVRPSAVTVLRGERGRDKLVRVEGLTQGDAESRLGRDTRRQAMKTMMLAMIVVLATALPGWAEHRTMETPEDRAAAEAARPMDASGARDLDVKLQLGMNGFKLGGRLFGPGGVASAWLNGTIGSDGLALDGRLQREDGRAWSFKLDVELMDRVTREAWRWIVDK